MEDLTILVADDHPLFRSALVQTLSLHPMPIQITESENYPDTLSRLREKDFDIALIDLNMPGQQGKLHLADICREFPEVVVVVISGHDDRQTRREVKALGAAGFITKSSSMEQLNQALNEVIEQGEFWDEDVDDGELKDVHIVTISNMTPQQKRVLAMIADGKLNKQIAFDLNIQETTIKQHVSAILKKLNVYNRTQAGIIYQQVTESHVSI